MTHCGTVMIANCFYAIMAKTVIAFYSTTEGTYNQPLTNILAICTVPFMRLSLAFIVMVHPPPPISLSLYLYH